MLEPMYRGTGVLSTTLNGVTFIGGQHMVVGWRIREWRSRANAPGSPSLVFEGRGVFLLDADITRPI
jgi:hypothetical protein